MTFKKTVLENKTFYPIVFIAGLVLVFGLLIGIRQLYLLFILFLFVVIYGLGRLYIKHVDDFLTVHIKKHPVRVTVGDDGHLELVIKQQGIMPIFNATISFVMDQSIEFQSDHADSRKGKTEVKLPFQIMFWEERTISLPFKAVARGISRVRSIQINIQNPFGFDTIYLSIEEPSFAEVIVYPEAHFVEGIERMDARLDGNHLARQSLFTDRLRTVGTREYMMGDPINRIHWKASAKAGDYQVKVDEQVGRKSWLFLINVRDIESLDALEKTISKIAFLATEATKREIPYALYVNRVSLGRIPFTHQPEGSGSSQLSQTLELLARIESHGFTHPFENMLDFILKRNHIPTDVFQAGRDDEAFEYFYRIFELKGAHVYHLTEDGIEVHKGGSIHEPQEA